MCRSYAKYGLMVFLLAAGGFVLGVLLAAYGFITLWWEFPRTWEPLQGVTGTPREIVTIDETGSAFLLRTADGALFDCQESACLPASVDWSASMPLCDGSRQPKVVGLFPILLSWDIRVAMGCERPYMDMARTVYVVQDSRGGMFQTGGSTMIPTDVGVILVGIVGGLVGGAVGLAAGAVAFTVLVVRKRRREQPES